MLIRNAKNSAGKPVEVWLCDGKIAAVGLGLLVPEGETVLDAKGRTVLPARSEERRVGKECRSLPPQQRAGIPS